MHLLYNWGRSRDAKREVFRWTLSPTTFRPDQGDLLRPVGNGVTGVLWWYRWRAFVVMFLKFCGRYGVVNHCFSRPLFIRLVKGGVMLLKVRFLNRAIRYFFVIYERLRRKAFRACAFGGVTGYLGAGRHGSYY